LQACEEGVPFESAAGDGPTLRALKGVVDGMLAKLPSAEGEDEASA